MRFRTFLRPSRKGSYRPRLAVLENRWCPTCDISVIDGHILRILGDETANRIEIRQLSDGMTNVSCDGETASFRGINGFDIATGIGDDFVTANFVSPPDPDFNFRADLGAGDDTFTATFSPAPSDLPPGPCRLDVVGQQGNDRLSLFLGGPDTRPERPLFNTALTANLDGGLGNDTALIDITNVVVNAPMSLTCNGGFGDDVMGWDWRDVTVNAPVTQSMNLGGGNDIAALNAYSVALNADAAINVNLGGGDDNAMIIYGNVAFNADAAINVMGGAGADQVTANLQLAPHGDFVFHADLGGGNNIFDAVLQNPPEPEHSGE